LYTTELATARRLMDAPPPIVKDRLRGRKHYYYFTNRITYVVGQAKGKKNDRRTTFYRTIIIIIILLPKQHVSLSWEWFDEKTIKMYNILYLYGL